MTEKESSNDIINSSCNSFIHSSLVILPAENMKKKDNRLAHGMLEVNNMTNKAIVL